MITPEKATLIDILTDGFEGGQGALESVGGWRDRKLPMPSEAAAKLKFQELLAEGTQWKGPPKTKGDPETEGVAKWPDLQVWWKGRGILVLVRDPGFDSWWHKDETWDPNPMDAVETLAWKDRKRR